MDVYAGEYLGWGWPENEKKWEGKEAQIFLGAMVLGLEELQKRGIVHNDLHSANYNTDELGYPVLIDFGCA